MGVKDKLELERLFALLDDLETMFKNEEISEETYSEMSKKYKEKISDIQDRLMEFEGDKDEDAFSKKLKDMTDEIMRKTSKIDAKELEDMTDEIMRNTTQITENVNEILKNTMRTLKTQLKSSGVDSSCCETHKEEATMSIPIEEGKYISLKCDIEHGKISIKGSDGRELKIFSEKRITCPHAEDSTGKLSKTRLLAKDKVKGDKHIIKISSELEKMTSMNIFLEVPNIASNQFVLSSERGKVTVRNIDCDEMDIDSENGGIDVRDLTCKLLGMNTETGSISVENVESENDVEINSENGNISLTKVRAPKIVTNTEKGNITAYVSTGRADLTTELGSIKYKAIEDKPQDVTLLSELGSIDIKVVQDKLPWHVEARVELGSIHNTSGLAERGEGGKKVFESAGYADSTERISVRAKTELGTISLH